MTRSMVRMLVGVLPLFLPGLAPAQAKHYPLESAEGLRLHNVVAQPATHKGKKGRLVADTARLRERMAGGQVEGELLASIEGVELSNGAIEVEVAGAPA
ncbi:MAG: hypothetical protein M3282_12145, partial [Gemmatimonadota bacterium]|nr:hypothetical protein [Gemmatimonadota bacterium]